MDFLTWHSFNASTEVAEMFPSIQEMSVCVVTLCFSYPQIFSDVRSPIPSFFEMRCHFPPSDEEFHNDASVIRQSLSFDHRESVRRCYLFWPFRTYIPSCFAFGFKGTEEGRSQISVG